LSPDVTQGEGLINIRKIEKFQEKVQKSIEPKKSSTSSSKLLNKKN